MFKIVAKMMMVMTCLLTATLAAEGGRARHASHANSMSNGALGLGLLSAAPAFTVKSLQDRTASPRVDVSLPGRFALIGTKVAENASPANFSGMSGIRFVPTTPSGLAAILAGELQSIAGRTVSRELRDRLRDFAVTAALGSYNSLSHDMNLSIRFVLGQSRTGSQLLHGSFSL